MPTLSTPPKVYLAGPEVFLANAKAMAEAKKELCRQHGFVGVFPLDADLALEGLPGAEKARQIGLADEGLIHVCQLVIANLTPFRGVSADIGTAYELGYARALGKPVFGYTNIAADYRQRAALFRATKGSWPDHGDDASVDMEDFGLAENLMLDTGIRESGGTLIRMDVAAGSELTDLQGFERCLEQAAKLVW
jgi:nucleoside 2-deoxyribosyltransferase